MGVPGSGVVDVVAPLPFWEVCVVESVWGVDVDSPFCGVGVALVLGGGNGEGGRKAGWPLLLLCSVPFSRISSTNDMKLAAWLCVRGGGKGYMPKMGTPESGLTELMSAGAGSESNCCGAAACVGSAGLAVARSAGGGCPLVSLVTHTQHCQPRHVSAEGCHVRDHFHVQLAHRPCEQSSSGRNSGMLASFWQQRVTRGEYSFRRPQWQHIQSLVFSRQLTDHLNVSGDEGSSTGILMMCNSRGGESGTERCCTRMLGTA